MSKIIVTGHRGFIGSYLMKHIAAIGIDLKDGNDIVDCELPDADVVIHLAAQAGVIRSMESPTETVRTNLLGTVRLAERYKDKRFIFASTGGAIQDEILSPYGLSKYCAENFIKMLFNDYVILRFANVYGGNSRSVVDKFLSEDEITIYGDGLQTRTFVHIDDLIEGIIASMGWKKGSYYFGGEDTHSIIELARITKKPISFQPARQGELYKSSLGNTTPGWKPRMRVVDYIESHL